MLTIGLTGGSGSGKSYIAAMFANIGLIPALNTDLVSRLVCMPGSVCLGKLAEEFGENIITPDGSLDRKLLAAIAFSDPEKIKILNKITHKYILEYCNNWLEQRKSDGCEAVIIEAPQLFESGFNKSCDIIIAVIADENIRLERILARDNITESEAKLRISRQESDEFFIANADYIIENNKNELEKQVINILRELKIL